jgi:hypothetical protein
MPGPESPFDPLDHEPTGSGKKDYSLLWILLPVILIFLAMMGSNLWHIAQGDYTGFAIKQRDTRSGH